MFAITLVQLKGWSKGQGSPNLEDLVKDASNFSKFFFEGASVVHIWCLKYLIIVVMHEFTFYRSYAVE